MLKNKKGNKWVRWLISSAWGVNYSTLDKYFLMCAGAGSVSASFLSVESGGGGNQGTEGLSKGRREGFGEQMKKRERERGREGSGRNPCTSQLPETEERETELSCRVRRWSGSSPRTQTHTHSRPKSRTFISTFVQRSGEAPSLRASLLFLLMSAPSGSLTLVMVLCVCVSEFCHSLPA